MPRTERVVIPFEGEDSSLTPTLRLIKGGLEDVQKASQGLNNQIAEGGKIFEMLKGAAFPLTAAITAIGGAMAGVMATLSAMEMSQKKLQAELRITGGSAGLTAQEMNTLASELRNTTFFSAGQVRDAETRLMAFKRISGNAFREVIQLAADMATLTGEDLTSATVKLARALEDPEKGMKALKEAGVVFTDAQKAMVKSLNEAGDAAKAQQYILDALKGSVGGLSAEMHDTFSGSVDHAKKAAESLSKELSVKLSPIAFAIRGDFELAALAFEKFAKAIKEPTQADKLQEQMREALTMLDAAISTGDSEAKIAKFRENFRQAERAYADYNAAQEAETKRARAAGEKARSDDQAEQSRAKREEEHKKALTELKKYIEEANVSVMEGEEKARHGREVTLEKYGELRQKGLLDDEQWNAVLAASALKMYAEIDKAGEENARKERERRDKLKAEHDKYLDTTLSSLMNKEERVRHEYDKSLVEFQKQLDGKGISQEDYDSAVIVAERKKNADLAALGEAQYQKDLQMLEKRKTVLMRYAEEAKDTHKKIDDFAVASLRHMDDALVNFVKKGQLEWNTLADAIITDLIRIQVQQSITGPIAQWMNTMPLFGGGAGPLGDPKNVTLSMPAPSAPLLGGAPMVVGALNKASAGPPSAASPVAVHQTINMNFNSLDAKSTAALIQQQSGTIQEIVAKGVRDGGAFANIIQGKG